MIKVRILDRCEVCDGEAYIFDYQDVDANGDSYDRYRPCAMCHGSGNRAFLIACMQFIRIIREIIRRNINGYHQCDLS